jgi:WD40 repeat protein
MHCICRCNNKNVSILRQHSTSFVTLFSFDPNHGWKCTDTLTGHKKAVECLCANDKYLFSGSGDQTIKVQSQWLSLF